ncbi:MAG: NAD(P)-dependent oxidoreductase [Candidatus Jorgensenbacteria bacterium]
MAKILVTGGAGYIGSILVPELLRAGHDVTIIDNFLFGQTPFLDVCHFDTLAIVRGDVRDKDLITEHIAGKDFILPLAALVGVPLCDHDPIAARTVNAEAVELILKLRKPGQKIIFPNTNSGYGMGQGDTVFCTEETPLNPISLYGRLKVEAERKVLDAGDSIAFRLATVCGMSPRMRIDLLVNDFVYRAVHDRFVVLFEAHFKRNYIHIRDVARVFIHAIEHFDAMKNNAYNVGLSDANLSKKELCEEIKRQIPNFVFIESEIGKDPDKRNYIVSNAKIEKTGFKPTVSIQDAIRELIKGYEIVKRHTHANI